MGQPEQVALVDPFRHPYFVERLRAAAVLREARAVGEVLGYSYVAQYEGGSADVYIIRDQSEGEPVLAALKCLATTKIRSALRATFLREAQLMLRVEAAALLRFLQVERDMLTGQLGIKMPYCAGGSLRDRLAAGVIPRPEAIYHLLAIAVGGASLHQQGVVHRDLKPENVLFAYALGLNRGEFEWETVVADFGISTAPIATGKGSFQGTLAYAAPELLRGGEVTLASDVFAWAVIAVEVLVSQHPYIDFNSAVPDVPRAALADIIEERLAKMKSVDIGVPPWLDECIHAGLAAVPDERPSFREIIDVFAQRCAFEFGHARAGAHASQAEARFPMSSTLAIVIAKHNWRMNGNVFAGELSVGFVALFDQVERLKSIGSLPAYREAIEKLSAFLGDFESPDGLLGQALAAPERRVLKAVVDAPYSRLLSAETSGHEYRSMDVNRAWVIRALDLLCKVLVSLVEKHGLPEDVRHLERVAKGWHELGEFHNVEQLAYLMQALVFTGDVERAMARFNDMPEADTVHELLAISLYDLFLMTGKPMDAAQLASKAMEKYDRPSFWALHAALAHFEADDYMRAIPELLKHVPDEIDMKQFLGWTLLARLGAERNERVWQGLRPYVFQPANPRKARIAIELAWHYGERDTCSRFAKYMLEEPLLALSIHRRHRAFFEAVAAGRCPNAETMKERVERRASAWEASGRHTSMLLSGFEFVCAYCRFGGRNKELSDAGLALIEKSYAKVGERGYWKILHTRSSCCMCRSKWRIENLGICGFCHRHYCCDCASSGTRCGCGGEIVG